jgi:hypothetical protein
MKFSLRTCTAILCTLLFNAPAMAEIVPEVEPNDQIIGPQAVTPDTTGTIHIDAVLGNLAGDPVADLDFYSFEAKAGDVITIDIDCGHNCGDRSFDSAISLLSFDSGTGNYVLRANNDDPVGAPDDGSVRGADDGTENTNYTYDARIDGYVVPTDGTYFVGVSNAGRYIKDNGLVYSTYVENGDYELIITGLTPPVVETPPAPAEEEATIDDPVVDEPAGPVGVNIEVKPGKRQWARFHTRHRGKIAVAILSSESFNPLEIDQTSLTFGATGTEDSLSRCSQRNWDFNKDGRPDLVCHFSNRKTGFDEYSTMVKITGSTTDGVEFTGQAPLKAVGKKRHRRDDSDGDHHRRHDRDDHDRDDRGRR